jgi:hypothetical protein
MCFEKRWEKNSKEIREELKGKYWRREREIGFLLL